MPQSLSQIILHLVFSTKDQRRYLNDSLSRAFAYVSNQIEYHREISFQDEFRELLRRYGIDFDERYVWG